jgi:hypothetical protein
MRNNPPICRDEMSQSFEYSNIWDAEKIMACICDIGHTGYDCSEWVCPNGDDPLTPNQVGLQCFICSITVSVDGRSMRFNC